MAIADDSYVPKPKQWTVEEIKAYLVEKALEYDLNPIMVLEIARCESGFRKDIISRTNDVGLLQVNVRAHNGSMEAQGLNIYNWVENTEYGLKLMKEQGTRPWKNSKHCHGY